MKRTAIPVTLLVFASLLLSACVADRQYLLGLTYYPSATLKDRTQKKPFTVALAPFADNRAEKKLLFDEYNKLGGQDRYYLRHEQLNLVFAAAIKQRLEDAGIHVVDIQSWDKTAEGLAGVAADAVLTGAIEDFSCRRDVGNNPAFPVLAGRTRVTVVWGDKGTGWVKEQDFEASFESEEFLYVTPAEIEHTLNVALSGLVEKIVRSRTLSEMMGD